MANTQSSPAVGTNSVVVATKEQVASDVGGEIILLSLETGMYYGLGQVGARIWDLLQRPMRAGDIRDTILAEYEVDAERCERDVLALLRDLLDAGLIEVEDSGEAA